MAIDVLQFRTNGADQWQVPLFETALTSGVVPLFVNKGDILHHIGTAFLISRSGVFVTAAHCIMEALRQHGFDKEEFEPGGDYDLLKTNVKLAVLHWHRIEGGIRASIWSMAGTRVFPPTDIAFGSLDVHDQPQAVTTPTLSFAIPVCDSEVLTLGYPRNDLPPIDLAAARAGRFDWREYQPPLVATIGTVKATILQGCSYVKGPCIVTTCPSRNGMSGGPVINASGNVCGLVSGSIMLEHGDGSMASLLYPILGMQMTTVWAPAQNLRMNFNEPLLLAIPRGLVRSDGTETLHRYVEVEGRLRIDPRVTSDNKHCIFDTRRDYDEGRPSQPMSDAGPT